MVLPDFSKSGIFHSLNIPETFAVVGDFLGRPTDPFSL
jgi:hypothetical protein